MTDDEGQAFFARIEFLEQQLAECQAREKVLRDALEAAHPEGGVRVTRIVKAALAMPSDSTALDTMLKAAKRQALLEAAESFDLWDWNQTCIKQLQKWAKELK